MTGEKLNWLYKTPKGRKYSFTALTDTAMEAVKLEGSEEPIGGWVSYGYSLRVPAPQLQLTCEGPAPFRCVTVIAPEGYQVTGEVSEEKAVIRFAGEKNMTLTLDGDEIRRD